jgi:NAD(P)-dependent dehydrogenase (short-subunit alcohol dehydrogenase family)
MRQKAQNQTIGESMPTVLVTGANRGLGLEFARQYAADGWQVLAACRSPEAAMELQRIAVESNRRIRVLEMDVTDAASVRAAAEGLKGEAIDLLLNNAGIGGPPAQRIGSLDYAAWAKVLDTNALGPMRVVEAFLENVAKSHLKQVVTITSGMGSIEDNTSGGRYAYRSSKAAVNMVMKSLSVDLAPRGITCVVMNPGWVRTDMGGAGGKLSPEESIRAMRSVIASLKAKDSGRFLNYTGKDYSW